MIVPLEEQFARQIDESKKELDSTDEDITLCDFLKIFVNLYGTSKWSPSTFSSKVGTIENYINPLIGDWKLNEITTKKLSAYYNDLLSVPEVPRANRKATGRCVQPANIKKIHDIIRCALNQAIRWEYIDTNKRNPASLATLPKVPKVKRKVWSVDTFREAIQQSDDDLLTICMHLAFSCSMRIGEITGLTWEDVIIDEQSIATNNARVIINKELSRVNAQAMQKLKEKDIIKIFPTQKPHCTTRLVFLMLVSVIVFVGINDGISVLSLYNRSHGRSSLFIIQPFIKAGLYNAVSGFEHYCLKTPLFDELIYGLSGNTQD